MGLGLLILILAVIFIVRGGNVLCIKLAQQSRVSSLRQTIVFMFFFSLFQVLLYFILPPYGFQKLDSGFIVFPLCFAVFYLASNIFLLLAISIGSAAMSNTIHQFSPVVPIVYGLVFWNERLSFAQCIGLLLFTVSILLINKSDYSVKGLKHKSSVKWLIYSVLAAASAGISVIFTKQCMLKFPHLAKEYLIIFTLIATAAALFGSLLYSRPDLRKLSRDKSFLLYIAAAALMFNINNYIFVLYIAKIQSAVFLTIMSCITMISIAVMGRAILKEKLSRRAVCAILICVLSIILVNIK